MKKFFFSICALAAVAVGCTKSEVINTPGAETPIKFETYSGRIPTTKATSVVGQDGLAEVGGFQVYAFIHPADQTPSYDEAYMDKEVTGTVTPATGENTEPTVAWGYNGVTYWPTTHQLDFVAYALNCGAAVTADATDTYTKINYTVADAVADQKDLLVATPVYNATSEDGNAVLLKFNHMLSRIGFSLVTSATNAVNVTIEDVILSGSFSKSGSVVLNPAVGEDDTPTIPAITANTAESVSYDLLGSGKFTSLGSADGVPVHDNSMCYVLDEGATDSKLDDQYVAKTYADDPEGTENGKTAVLKKAEDDEAAKVNLDNRHMMIIPTAGHGAKLTVTYALPLAGESFVVEDIDVSSIEFKAGMSYEFKFKVATNTVGFTVEVQTWNTATGEIDEVIQLS